jgi:hypothetical protein
MEEEFDQSALLFVDVNLGNGLKPRITLYQGDKPEKIAKEFAKKYSK